MRHQTMNAKTALQQKEKGIMGMKEIKRNYYGIQIAIVIFIVLIVVQRVFADTPASESTHRASGFTTMIQIIMTGLLGYVAWSLRRFVKAFDKMKDCINIVMKVLIAIGIEHKSNHDSCVNFDELMKPEGE